MILAILLIILAALVGFWVGAWVMKGENSYSRVKEFHKAFGHPAPDKPGIIDDSRSELRIELIREELFELREAVVKGDLVAIADALGDLDYVVNGAAIEYGIDLPAITAEIHKSNMTKLGPNGKPIYREDGKILKGKDYQPPRLEQLLGL